MKRKRLDRRRSSALRTAVGAILAALLLTAANISPTQASWTDTEATGLELRAGVVPAPQNVSCGFPRLSIARLRNLTISWERPGTSPETVSPTGYRLDFYARGSPAPTQPFKVVTDLSYTNFTGDLREPILPLTVFEYDIHLVSVGPGTWESASRVIKVQTWRGLLGPQASCSVENAPTQGLRGFYVEEAPHESDPEELPPEDEDASGEEFEGNDAAPVPAPTPTDESSSPEDAQREEAELDGPASTPSQDPLEEGASPGEQESQEPGGPPTAESSPEPGDQQDTAEPSDEETPPDRDGARDSGGTTAPEDPLG